MSAARARGRADEVRRIEIVTPEGVPLSFAIASYGDRFHAFVIDFLIVHVVVFALAIVVALAGQPDWGGALLLLVAFLLQNFYFVWHESHGLGRTPGKRIAGIRVIDAGGGPLRTDAVLVRNLTRVLEMFLPIQVVLSPEALWPGAPGGLRLAAVTWIFAFAFLPLFNRRRLRIGDIVGGTLVVRAPRVVLLEDPVRAVPPALGRALEPVAFTDAQLDVYGIYELQVLEDVLRRGREPGGRAAMGAVYERIRQKIGFSGQAPTERFLRDFYAALRARLERRLLLGKRKEDKFAR